MRLIIRIMGSWALVVEGTGAFLLPLGELSSHLERILEAAWRSAD